MVGDSIFHKIISLPNLIEAWKRFRKGKRNKKDVASFDLFFEDNIFKLQKDLETKSYIHDQYDAFYVYDPKRRHIHKASVRDRVLHQAIFQVLYPIFDKHFIYDSYSSRDLKGTHAGFTRLENACRKASNNWKQNIYVLKCDIRKFFDSIDHSVLRDLIVDKIFDADVLWLIDIIFESFEKEKGKGLPLGNVTSQLFANVYLNELDQFAKHQLKAKYYFRYCDDFVIVHQDRYFLEGLIGKIRNFLKHKLLLDLHPNKVEIRKIKQGIDFLGYVLLPHAQVVRTKTKQRLFRKLHEAKSKLKEGKISQSTFDSTIQSYLGVLSHCRNREVRIKAEKFIIK